MCQNWSTKCSGGHNPGNCRAEANHYPTSASLPVALLFFPCPHSPVMNQKNNSACHSWEGRHKRPKDHRQPGPTAQATKGLRRKKHGCLVAELFALDKMELTVLTKTRQSQAGGGEGKKEKSPVMLEV